MNTDQIFNLYNRIHAFVCDNGIVVIHFLKCSYLLSYIQTYLQMSSMMSGTFFKIIQLGGNCVEGSGETRLARY